MPQLGFGTWLSEPNVVGESVQKALENGYRHIDCASCYGNEPEVGKAFTKVFSDGKVKREDVFITSKLWVSDFGKVSHSVISPQNFGEKSGFSKMSTVGGELMFSHIFLC